MPKTIIHLVSSNKWGEAQRYVLDICRHFHDSGCDVTAMTRDAQVVDSKFTDCGIPLLHAPLRGFFDPASAWILARRLKTIPRDEGIVHVHRYRDAFTVLLAKRIANRPDIRVVSTRHTVRRGRNSWLFRRIYDKLNGHIFVSEAAFLQFKAPWKHLPMRQERVHILHNSVNTPVVSPAPEPMKGPVIAAYLGPVVKGKGIETVIDALPSLRDLKLRFRIIGRGVPDYLDTLRRRAMTRGVMEMIDWNTKTDYDAHLLDDTHFTVLPSIVREAFGLSNIRSMAAGRAQISTAGGSQAEYLSDGETALIIPPADAHSVATAMRRLATEPDTRARIGDAAFRDYKEKLSWPVFIKKLSEIYDSL